ncbi:MAG: NAD-dependent epimerase/dehydratase family protein, partial [Patescibacteria group bacterium]|nr:NAD-dependent epimerase/dehydratase family protein [Patescibacteria group bacterium]
MATNNQVFKKKNVVVAGGAGFIGSHICEALAKAGNANIICIDNLVSGSVMNIERLLQVPDFKFIRHDISMPLDLAQFPELAPFEIEFAGIQEIY